MDIAASITGLPQLDAKLAQFAANVQWNILVAAAKRAAEPVLQSAQSKMPITRRGDGSSGLLFNSLQIVPLRAKKGIVGARVQEGGLGFYQGATFYGGFLEYGHRIGKRTAEVRKLKALAYKSFKKKQYALSVGFHELAASVDKRQTVDPHPYLAEAAAMNVLVVPPIFQAAIAEGIGKAMEAN
jgi:hypothetical protein